MISVIIPYYNPGCDSLIERLLERAVESVLSQDTDVEVIVVDDGSPVPPRNLFFKLGDSRTRLIEATHGRLGAARNRGIEAAKGDVLAFLDADDYYFEGTLRLCLDCMERNGADLLGFGFKICGEEGCDAPDNGSFGCTAPVTGKQYMAGSTPFGSSCMYLARRSLIYDNELRFAENTYMEDEDFTPRMLFFSRRFVCCDIVAYAYCRREGSITTTHLYDEHAVNTLNVTARLQLFMEAHKAEDCRGIQRKIRYLAMDHIRHTLRRPDWRKALPVQAEALRKMELWPLQKAGYGLKYSLFVMLSNTAAGRQILHINEKKYSE